MAELDQDGPGRSPAPFGGPWRPEPAAEDLVRHDVHGDPLLRRLSRGAARPFRASQDVQALAEHGRWIQHPVTTGRRIAVTGIRGGCGKSTVAALISAVFARYRQDRVLALDLDPELGSLPLRLGIPAGHSLADLARAGLGTASFAEVEPYLARMGERLWALPGSQGAVGGAGLDADVYRAAGLPLSRFFGVTVTDCGVGVHTPLHHGVLAAAHAQVLVTPATPEGAASAGRALDYLAAGELRHLVARTVVVFTVPTPNARRLINVGQAREILREVGADALVMNHDRHLAIGTTVDPSRLAYTTRVSAIAIAAAALNRALPA
ncbi:MinD/ParA family ATP-binding protein [Actinomadura fibrosa]|uniref:MinD/ParA family protein n=1 Tax=Actinomadura fibrosa TaxID=111802 RepID=A0ABW2XJV7_9ACTN|nr:MinD/ParA family protein [Actinomadura fibrosa]